MKRSFADVLQNRHSYKFRKAHRKARVLETATSIKKGLNQHRCFPVKLAKFFRTTFLREHFR